MTQSKEELEELLGKEHLRGIRKETLNQLALRYRFVSLLGAGGNASVFKVVRNGDDQSVAIKILRNGTDEKKSRFKREVEILVNYGSKVRGLMPIGAHAVDEHEHWYEMPITEPVFDRLSKLPLRDRLRQSVVVVLSCAETLSKLHGLPNSISHRDIKPDNIHFNGNDVVIGDFGLVDVPELDNLTRSDMSLGPIFTMAPEMRRNPKTADGRKADVYSLAKTLWMLVKKDKYAFDGPYDWSDEKIALGGLSGPNCKLHLAELEELIKDATDNDPERRPSMLSVEERLKAWCDAEANPERAQVAEWDFLKRIIFGRCVPSVSIFRHLESITTILRAVSHTSAANHTLFSFHGGLDLIGVKSSSEADCLVLRFDNDTVVIKPNVLQIGVFENSELNYLLIEAGDISPVPGIEVFRGIQELVEDTPGHYVGRKDAVYGVYDYDTGVPLPKGWRYVTRMIKGRLLIVSKTGPYNAIAEVYDGRHGECSMSTFHSYVERIACVLKLFQSKGIDWRKMDLSSVSCLSKNPFVKGSRPDAQSLVKRPAVPMGFFREKILSCDFSPAFKELSIVPQRKGSFLISLEPCTMVFGAEVERQCGFELSIDGHFHADGEPNAELAYFSDLGAVRRLVLQLERVLDEFCQPYGTDCLDFDYAFTVRIVSVPSHSVNFNANDILRLVNNADDRQGSRFVVDADGTLRLLVGEQARCARFYPVRMEFFEPRNNYVGKYSHWDLKTANRFEAALKNAWNEYCGMKHFVYRDSW
ncbi:MAG: protein kinase [Kiritimatiellae bacterium]|nr:protein kinase [Kiritimatiellia bacterium]